MRRLPAKGSRYVHAPEFAADIMSARTLGLQILQLVGHVLEFFGFRQRSFGLRDGGPLARQLDIKLDEILLVRGDILFGIDRIDRAFGHANRAVDAFIRVDREKVRSFAEAIYRAYIDAIRVTAADAGFGHNVGHNGPICKKLEMLGMHGQGESQAAWKCPMRDAT
jgi:hypothetical protein